MKTKGLKTFSGKQLKYRAERDRLVTPSKYASDVLDELRRKYGAVYDNERFYHRGKNNWCKVR